MSFTIGQGTSAASEWFELELIRMDPDCIVGIESQSIHSSSTGSKDCADNKCGGLAISTTARICAAPEKLTASQRTNGQAYKTMPN